MININMEFNVFIEQDEDSIYVAKVPEIEGCHTQGKTMEEVVDRIKEAIEVCLESNEEEVNPMKFIGMQRIQIKKSQIA